MFIEIDAARRRESHIAPRLAQDRRDHPDCGRFAIGPGNRQYRNAAGPSWREEHVDHRFGYIACLAFGRFKMHAEAGSGVHLNYAAPCFTDRAGNIRRTEIRSEEHTSELQSLKRISYDAFCFKKQNKAKRHV